MVPTWAVPGLFAFVVEQFVTQNRKIPPLSAGQHNKFHPLLVLDLRPVLVHFVLNPSEAVH